jgi:hypothetical protein
MDLKGLRQRFGLPSFVFLDRQKPGAYDNWHKS